MNFVNVILLTLSRLHPHFSDIDEPIEHRHSRLEVIANAIEKACNIVTCIDKSNECKPIYHDRAECAATLIVLGQIESGFAYHVHKNECKPHECDKGKAIGLWQTHKINAWNDEQWNSMKGDSLEATTATALYTAKLIAGGVGQCGTLAGSISRYNNGRRCDAYLFESTAKRAQQIASNIRIKIRQ